MLGLNRQRSQDTETALSPLRKNSQDGFLAQMDKVNNNSMATHDVFGILVHKSYLYCFRLLFMLKRQPVRLRSRYKKSAGAL